MLISFAFLRGKGLSGLNSYFRVFIKIGISCALLFWVLKRVQFSVLGASLLTYAWTYIVFSFIVVNLCMFVSALKWQYLLNVQQIQMSLKKLLMLYYVGLFANNFLPSSIGGDAMRIYDVAKISGKAKEAAASVIMERLLASLALALTAGLALAIVTKTGGHNLVYWPVVGILVACTGVLAVLFWYPFSEVSTVGQWLGRLGLYRGYPLPLFKVLLLSFLFQGLLVAANIFIFKALGTDIQLIKHFLYIPVIMAVSMLPLSINGIGVRESMFIMLYGRDGVEPSVAVMCSLLFFMLITIASLLGGVFLAARKLRR